MEPNGIIFSYVLYLNDEMHKTVSICMCDEFSSVAFTILQHLHIKHKIYFDKLPIKLIHVYIYLFLIV